MTIHGIYWFRAWSKYKINNNMNIIKYLFRWILMYIIWSVHVYIFVSVCVCVCVHAYTSDVCLWYYICGHSWAPINLKFDRFIHIKDTVKALGLFWHTPIKKHKSIWSGALITPQRVHNVTWRAIHQLPCWSGNIGVRLVLPIGR